jgi:hypothetical protein
LIEAGIKFGNSGPLGKALMVSGSEVANHLNQQRQDIFFPDANTTALDRLGACAEIGGGSVAVAAAVTEVFAGTLTTAVATGGAVEVATTAGTTAAAVSADGNPTNEVQAVARVFWSGGKVAQQAAEAWAKANNATTLEMTKAGQRLQEITKSSNWATQRPQWVALSQEFAAGAVGKVDVFQSAAGVRLQSIWATVEYQTP